MKNQRELTLGRQTLTETNNFFDNDDHHIDR